MEMLENDFDDPDYKFICGTNDGIAIVNINKQTLKFTLAKEAYLGGRVVNNLLVRGNRILAFIHGHQKFKLIDRKTKDISDIAWMGEDPALFCTGLTWAPNFHTRELSVVFLRDTSGVHMINTQTWNIQTLINISDGSAKFPDLSLLEVVEGDDHQLIVYTIDKNDKFLIKRSYSHILKYCLQTASLRTNCFKPGNLSKRLE